MSLGKARVAALAAALLFSTGGAGIKTGAFSAAQVSCVRSGIAAIALYAWWRWRRQQRGPVPLPTVFGIGAIYAMVLTLFVFSTKLTTAANAIFLQATAPLYILALSPWLLRERVTRRDVGYMAVLAVGLALCFAGQQRASAIATNPSLGNALAVICSVSWAFTLIALRWAQRGERDIGVAAVIAGNFLAAVAALPFAWPFPTAGGAEWGTLIYLGVVQIGVAYICLTAAMRTLPALEVSLLLLLEPVLNPMWTWLVRGEAPGQWVVAGGALIIGATAVQGIIASRE
jgi:drug/metabolite transporter, DME family